MRVTSGLVSLRCDYCGSVCYVTPDDQGVQYLGEEEELPCPVCAVPLWDATLAGVPLHACKKCRGLLVPMGAFAALIEQVRTQHPGAEIPVAEGDADLSRRLECPQCHHTMDTHFYYGGGHVVMEDCERCELNWLDGGALMRIVHAPHAEETAD
jgi:Zn-finger nucleic acid-binding protein